MGHPDNYFPHDLSTEELVERMRAVIESAEMIRKEINRIRNHALGKQSEIPRSIVHILGHIQNDLVHARLEFAYMLGLKGEEFERMVEMLRNPHLVNSNGPNDE